MSTITKERVAGIASGEKCYTHDDVVELARIALASLEAEPVAWTWEIYGGGNMYAKIKPASLDANPLYTAPPAPVAVPAAYEKNEDFSAYHEGWNACRAAMLQGADGNSPVIPDAYDIKAFGIFSATEGENGLMMEVERFHFETDSCPQVGKDKFVPKFAIQAIINRLQKHCDNMEADALVDVLSTSSAPLQEVKP